MISSSRLFISVIGRSCSRTIPKRSSSALLQFSPFKPPTPADSFGIRMASGGVQFPPQTQEQQPGKEHAMYPNPQAISPDYKPANKLHVILFSSTSRSNMYRKIYCNWHACMCRERWLW